MATTTSESKVTMPDKDQLAKVLFKEYDDLIDGLNQQIETYKNEHILLKKEITQLASENTKLAKAHESTLKKNMISGNATASESEVVSNLKEQLVLCQKEKEVTNNLHQSSLRMVKILEEEMKKYEVGAYRSATSMNTMLPNGAILESKIKVMKEQLEIEGNARDQLESENLKYQTEIAKLKVNVETYKEIIEEQKKDLEVLTNKYMKLEQDYVTVNTSLEHEMKTRKGYVERDKLSSRKIDALLKRNREAEFKVSEALDIIDKLYVEREAAVARSNSLQQRGDKLLDRLQLLMSDMTKRMSEYKNKMKQKWEVEREKLTTEFEAVKNDLKRSEKDCNVLCEKLKKVEKLNSARLEKEKVSLIKGSETELVALENQLSSVYQEYEKLRLNYDMLQEGQGRSESMRVLAEDNYKKLLAERKTQETIFREQLQLRERQIEEAGRRAELFVQQVKQLEIERNDLVAARQLCTCETMRVEMEKRKSQVADLEAQVTSLIELNAKWKLESGDMARKLSGRIEELKKKLVGSSERNRKLRVELAAARCTALQT